MLGILVAVNYLASRRNHRWDLTAGKQFSVADQTRNILQKLDAPVKVLVFDKTTNFDTFRDRLDEYQYLSNRKLTAEYISPDKDPVRANQYKIQSYGTVVFNYKNRSETVVGTDEQQLTNTLIKVLSGAERTVYFLQGHGEHDTAGSARDGYSTIYQALGAENYKTETLALAQKREVPADATVLVDRRAAHGPAPAESGRDQAYLDRGRQAARPARSAGQGRSGAAHEPHRPAQGLGHRGREQHRRRHERCRPAARRRRGRRRSPCATPSHPIIGASA